VLINVLLAAYGTGVWTGADVLVILVTARESTPTRSADDGPLLYATIAAAALAVGRHTQNVGGAAFRELGVHRGALGRSH